MKKLSFILAGLILGCPQFSVFAAQDATANEQEITISSAKQEIETALEQKLEQEITTSPAAVVDKYEAEKWQYVEKYFTSGMNASKFHQKFGRFLNKYYPYLSILSTAALLYPLSSRVGAAFQKSGKRQDLNAFFLPETTENSYGPAEHEIAETKVQLVESSILIVASIITFLIIKNLLQISGKKLENKKDRYTQLLINFVQNWETNKDHTPKALQPLFQDLSNDLAVNRKFTKLVTDKKLAQKIVETVIASAIIANSLKQI